MKRIGRDVSLSDAYAKRSPRGVMAGSASADAHSKASLLGQFNFPRGDFGTYRKTTGKMGEMHNGTTKASHSRLSRRGSGQAIGRQLKSLFGNDLRRVLPLGLEPRT